MGAPSPEIDARGFEIPMTLHETAEFDAASAPNPGEAATVGGLTRCDELHPQTEFDCSRPVGEEATDQAAPGK
jgi:hypothetical protein